MVTGRSRGWSRDGHADGHGTVQSRLQSVGRSPVSWTRMVADDPSSRHNARGAVAGIRVTARGGGSSATIRVTACRPACVVTRGRPAAPFALAVARTPPRHLRRADGPCRAVTRGRCARAVEGMVCACCDTRTVCACCGGDGVRVLWSQHADGVRVLWRGRCARAVTRGRSQTAHDPTTRFRRRSALCA